MKYAILLSIILLTSACNHNEISRPDRPEPTPDPIPTTNEIFFASNKAIDILTDQNTGNFTVTISRSEPVDSEISFEITTDIPDGTIKAVSPTIFKVGESIIPIVMSYDIPTLTPGNSTSAALHINGSKDNNKTLNINILQNRETPKTISATYIHDCKRFPVSVSFTPNNGTTTISVNGDGFKRQFTINKELTYPLPTDISGSDITLVSATAGNIGEGIIESLDIAAARLRDQGHWTDNIYNVENAVDDNATKLYFGIAYTSTDGNATPAIDCLEFSGGEWQFVNSATFIDGWLLPSITINAQRYLPEEHPWQIAIYQNRENSKLLRLDGMYRNSKCPLNNSNGAAANTYLYIDITKPDCVTISPQEAPYQNSELWQSTLYMADGVGIFGNSPVEGGITSTLNISPDGTHTIRIPYPALGTDINRLSPFIDHNPAIITFQRSTE